MPRRHVLEHEDDALQLVQRLALAQLLLQLLDAVAEDLAVGAGVHGKHVIVVADPEGSLVELELDLAALEDRAVAVAEDRHQHLAGELLFHRVPLDVEELRSLRGRAVLQQVEPERVARADAHVVRHDVEHVPQTRLVQRTGQALVPFVPAQLGVDRAVVEDVVPVHRSGRRPEDRAGVQVGDAELGEIACDRGRALEGEARVQLHAVGRERLPGCRKLGRHLVEQAVGLLPHDLPLHPHSASRASQAAGTTLPFIACGRTAQQDVQAPALLPRGRARKTGRAATRAAGRSSCACRPYPAHSSGPANRGHR